MKFQDFEVIETLAETHAGKTMLYLCRHQQKLQVIKAIDKESVINDGKAIEHLKNQKEALKYFTQLENNNVCKLYATFQDDRNVYLQLQMVDGLPLHKLMQMTGKFTSRFSIIILTQIAEIMRQFHNEGFIYRDIKSSNFMVDQKGKVRLIDLGKAKRIKKERTYTICGTTHAMPPEIYAKNGYSYEFDYYSFGILVYELLVGTSPFGYATSNKNILQEIQSGITKQALEKIEDENAKDIISKLLHRNPSERMGKQRGFQQILDHPFFDCEKQFALEILEKRQKMSPYEKDFSEYVSQIQDFGLDQERFQEISEEDPFFKFLEK